MDYFAEIAGAADAVEALTRLRERGDAPRHLLEAPLYELHSRVPTIWRAELSNWFYNKPQFAAAVWEELRHCRVHRERVARVAVTLVELHPRTAAVGEWDSQALRDYLKQTVPLIPYLRAAWVQAVAVQYGHQIRPVPDSEQAIRALADALKPIGPLDANREDAHLLMEDLSAAAAVAYEPPGFISGLLREKESTAAQNQFTLFWRVRPARPRWTPAKLIASRGRVLALARRHAVPVPFAIAHGEELSQVADTRQETGRAVAYASAAAAAEAMDANSPPCNCPPENATAPVPDCSPMRRALSQNLFGLAFSGGGIRSATFNLGVLQALAKLDVLRHCDYLSTVSGGGYIGSWFSAWMQREGERIHNSSDPSAQPAAATLDEMRLGLSPNRSPNPLDPRVRPIRYLREFSNYLTPKTGFFSADTWTMAAIYIRNLILNLLVLIPLFAAALLIPRAIFELTVFLHSETTGALWVPAIMAGLLLISAFVLILNLRRATPPRNVSDRDHRQKPSLQRDEPVPWYSKQGWIQISIVVPLLAVAWLTASSYWLPLHGRLVPLTSNHVLLYWCDKWSLPRFSAILPHDPNVTAIYAMVAVAVIILFVFLTARNLASRWLKGFAAWGALTIAVASSAGLTWLLIWSLELLVRIGKSGARWQAFLHDFWSAAAALLVVLTVGVAIGTAILRGKKLLRSTPQWISASILASAAATLLASVLWALGQFLPLIAPSGPLAKAVSRAWPKDALTATSLSAAVVLFVFLTIFAATRGFTKCWPNFWHAIGSLLLALAGSGVAAFGAFWALGKLLDSFVCAEGFWYAIAFGTPLTLSVFALVVVMQLGFLGINFPDEQREWWSRLRAWTLIYSAAWTGLFLLAVFPKVWVDALTAAVGNWGGPGAVALWIASTVAGVKTGPKAAAAEKKARETAAANPASAAAVPQKAMSATALKAIATITPYIFIIGLLAFLSLVIYWTLGINEPYWNGLTEYPNWRLALAAVVLVGFSTLISWRIGVNEFSMHHFYKNRLVRCYLGASRWQQRKADWFTGFDSADDIRLKKFDRRGHDRPSYPYAGPYPIVNAALNLVGGEDLAWQERKATSFTFTPKYCGYDVDRAVLTADKRPYWPDAYAPTRAYMFDKLGPMLGTAMAISGAAANPNMGKITTSASAFLMTVFNVRLGWWLPNPRRKEQWTDPTPRLGVTYSALELFGLTDDKKLFVNVSDGGHFENLGVYELIRRGCRFIVACDAGQDGSFGMEDLGNVIRKCRTDFGVEIDICIDRIRDRDKHGWSNAHCVVGTIRYPGIAKHCRHGRVLLDSGGMPVGEDGLLIYLKPSISGDEPYDILEYYTRVPEFPHETTADQWFNESQFESYRRLGLHIAETAFQRYRERDDEAVFPPELFERLQRFWYPPSPKIAQYSNEHALEYSRIMELVRSGDDMKFLDSVLFEDIEKIGLRPSQRDEFYVCNALIQLIENVYADLDLEQSYAHPHVGGWIKVFRHWVKQPAFERTWKRSESTYAERFRNFYNDRLVNGP
jgi:hypothetical protein